MGLNLKRYCDFELKSADEKGIFTGYASVFNNIDKDGDVIVKGAFTKSLTRRKPKLLFQHKIDEPIGLIEALYEDENGLYIEKGLVNLDVEKGAETYSNMKKKILDKMSIGFKTVDFAYDKETGVRFIKEIDLYEVSIVTFPANDMAEVDSVKSNIEGFNSLADVEKFLREVKDGLSHSEAKHFISRFKSLLQRDVVERERKEAQELLEIVKNLTIKQ
jgi:HK97 family phage prohead protease